MAKTLIAQNIVGINSLSFKVEKGKVTGLTLSIEVNYGELGLTHQFDAWADFTPAQQSAVQNIYDRLLALTSARFIGS